VAGWLLSRRSRPGAAGGADRRAGSRRRRPTAASVRGSVLPGTCSLLTKGTDRRSAGTRRQMVGAPDAVDATLGRRDDPIEALAGQVGQLHAIDAGPQRLAR